MLISEVKAILEICNKKMLLDDRMISLFYKMVVPNDHFFSFLNVITGQFQAMGIVPIQIDVVLTLLLVDIQIFV